jgi:adenylosuccinate synthase
MNAAGPFPTETRGIAVSEEHNRRNEWQGPVRYGWFDAVSARYALRAAGGLDALAVTHVDRIHEGTAICTAYEGLEDLPCPPAAEATLEAQETVGSRLFEAVPILQTPRRFLDALERRSVGRSI